MKVKLFKRKRRRGLSLLLAVVMVFGLLPITAMATDSEQVFGGG